MEVIYSFLYFTKFSLNCNSIQQSFIFCTTQSSGHIQLGFSSRRDPLSLTTYWSCAHIVLQKFSKKFLLGSCGQGEENEMATLMILLVPLSQLPAERSTLYYSFSRRSISEAIFSFLDNLSRNIKDSLTTVKLQLILEWHSDVSHPEMNSYSPLFISIMD